MLILLYSYLFLIAFVLSLLLVPVMKKLAVRIGAVDQPSQRKVHRHSKPLLGGLAIAATLLLVIGVHLLAGALLADQQNLPAFLERIVQQRSYLGAAMPRLVAIIGGAILMVGVGLLDDLKGEKFPYQIKFVAQFIAAGWVALAGVHTSFLPLVWMNQLLSVFWIVGITNAFNLLDNMDGQSAGVAAITAAIFFSICVEQAQFFNAVLLITLIGAILGFLRYNFSPASIFMGDTGSLFLGFLLGSITLVMSYAPATAVSILPVTVIVPLLVLSVPIFDTLSVMMIRLREKRPLFVGDKRHFSDRLVEQSMSHRGAVIFIYLVTLCIGVGASFLPFLPGWAVMLVLLQTVAIYAMIAILMAIGKRRHQEILKQN